LIEGRQGQSRGSSPLRRPLAVADIDDLMPGRLQMPDEQHADRSCIVGNQNPSHFS